MRYDDNLIDEILSRNNIVDVIGERVNLHKKGANYWGLCPFHGEKTASFSVSASKQMFYCFGCGKGGNVLTFLKESENMTGREAVKYLAERAGVEMPRDEYTAEEKRAAAEREQLLEIHKEAAVYYHNCLKSPVGKVGLEYLRKRGLSDETIIHFGLGYADGKLYQHLRGKGFSDAILAKSGLITYDEKRGPNDKFWNRVMFPIMDPNNKVIAFGGRVMGDGEPKYLNSPETVLFDKSRTLYGLNYAKRTRKPFFLLCEGYMDVIALQSAGFENAVASLGTAFTSLNAKNIKKYVQSAVLTFDSDSAGRKAALRAIPILKREGIGAKVLTMKPHKDPDEFIKNLGPEAYEQRILNAQPSFLFEVECIEQNYDMADPDSKTKFYHEIAQKLSTVDDTILRNNYIDAVDRIYHIGADNLRRLSAEKAERHDGYREEDTDESEKPVIRKKPKSDDALVQAEKLLLTWAAEDSGVLKTLKDYITEEDFPDEPYHGVAKLLFNMSDTGGISPGAIIDRFDTEEEQAIVAGIFSYELRENLSESEREKTFQDTVRRVLKATLDKQCDEAIAANDTLAYQKLSAKKRELPKLKISLKANK